MNKKWKQWMQKTGGTIAAVAMSLGIAGIAAGNNLHPQGEKDPNTIRIDGGFYCNMKALSPKERAPHIELTEKLLAARNETIETEKGYELQDSPDKVSIAEVGEWWWQRALGEAREVGVFAIDRDRRDQGVYSVGISYLAAGTEKKGRPWAAPTICADV